VSTPVASTGNTASSGDIAADTRLIATYQQTLVADQHTADVLLSREQADLKNEQAVCGSMLASLGGAPTSTSQQASTETTPAEPPDGAPATNGDDCIALLNRILAEQTELNDALKKVSADEKALDAAVQRLLADMHAAPPAGSGPPSGSGGSTATSGSTDDRHGAARAGSGDGTAPPAGNGNGNGGGSGGGGGNPARSSASGSDGGARSAAGNGGATSHGPASAATIAADQAAVDAAKAELGVAQQNLDQASLVSPIAGTVAAVNITMGQQVQPGSSTDQVVVVGPGSFEVMTTVSDTDLPRLKIGDKATVTPDGTSTVTAGKVVAIGMLPTASGSSGSSGSAAYPVTIGLDAGGDQLFAGSGAAVTIVTGRATDTLAVPASAVHTIGTRQFVSVLRDGTSTTIPVTVGAVGPTLTEITSGVSEGDQVVLADLSTPLPTSNPNLRGPGGGGAGFGGGIRGPGGGGPGGPAGPGGPGG
jgi:hypothetical protein